MGGAARSASEVVVVITCDCAGWVWPNETVLLHEIMTKQESKVAGNEERSFIGFCLSYE
jgi:hypothetical protein